MYPPSPYAVPVGSFQTPVALPTTDPLEGPFFYIGINCDWMPLIVGALKQLLLQSTWATTDVDALQKVQGQVFNLIAQFNCATAPTLEQLCGTSAAGDDCDMGCCLRFQNGVLQELNCGVWTDVAGQPAGGIFSPGQPGAGSPQPTPGGGCQLYHANLPGNGVWLLPTTVSTGDTLLISGEVGVSYNNVSLDWYCPDGSVFFAGLCTGITQLDGGNPLPSVPTNKIIAFIGGTAYDVEGPMFTVPGGISNQQVQFQVNIASLSDGGGSVGFDVEVCNNQLGTFTHTFDFTTSPSGWVLDPAYSPGLGAWVAGQGWSCADSGLVNTLYRRVVDISITFPSTHITSLQATYTNQQGIDALSTERSQFALFNNVYYQWNRDMAAALNGTNLLDVAPLDNPGTTKFELGLQTDTDASGTSGFTGHGWFSKVVVTGIGSDPF